MENSSIKKICFSWDLFLSILFWIVCIFIVTNTSVNSQGEATRAVTTPYRDGAVRWYEGRPLYENSVVTGHHIIYPPQSYIISIPFAYIPGFIGEFIWRLFSVGLWAFAIIRLAYELKRCVRNSHYFVFKFSVIAVLLSLPAMRCGQYTLPLAGAMLLASLAMVQKHWNAAIGWLFLGMLIKPLILPMLLLTFVLFPAMRLRLIGALVVFFLFPFLYQRPAYVTEQYQTYPQVLKRITEVGDDSPFATLFHLAKYCGIKIPETVWTFIRAASAFLVLCLCFVMLRHFPPLSPYFVALWFFSLTVSYLLLMNPRTENNSYAMLAPLIGSYLLMELRVGKRYFAAFLIALMVGYIGHYELFKKILMPENVVIVCPFLTLLLFGYLTFRIKTYSFTETLPA